MMDAELRRGLPVSALHLKCSLLWLGAKQRRSPWSELLFCYIWLRTHYVLCRFESHETLYQPSPNWHFRRKGAVILWWQCKSWKRQMGGEEVGESSWWPHHLCSPSAFSFKWSSISGISIKRNVIQIRSFRLIVWHVYVSVSMSVIIYFDESIGRLFLAKLMNDLFSVENVWGDKGSKRRLRRIR